MKKKLYSSMLSMLAIAAVAQNPTGRLVPNETNPTGIIYNYTADNFSYYTSEYVPNLADAGTINTAEGNIKYTGKKNSSTFQQAMYRIEAGGQIDIDISSNPILYIKMKGTVGDVVKISLKNSAYTDQNTGDDFPNRYFGGFNIQQPLTCTDYSWYKFDFTGIYAQQAPSYTDIPGTNVAATKNRINTFEITNEVNLTGRASYDFYIDSVLMGATGIVPQLPVAAKTKWVSPFGAFNAPKLDYTYSNTPGNTCLKVNGENVFTYTAQNVKDNYETNYEIYGNAGKISLDIRKNPFIQASISGNVGDTLRFNLKKSDFTFIDGYDYLKVITATGYQNYTFDFTPKAATLTNIAEISMNLYPKVPKTASWFKMSSLVVGGDVEFCSFPTGIVETVFATPNKASFYPNPVSAGEKVSVVGTAAQTVQVVDVLGSTNLTLPISNNQFTIPESLKSGLYVIVLKGDKTSSTAKLQVK